MHANFWSPHVPNFLTLSDIPSRPPILLFYRSVHPTIAAELTHFVWFLRHLFYTCISSARVPGPLSPVFFSHRQATLSPSTPP
jgi:hypothetical protein